MKMSPLIFGVLCPTNSTPDCTQTPDNITPKSLHEKAEMINAMVSGRAIRLLAINILTDMPLSCQALMNELGVERVTSRDTLAAEPLTAEAIIRFLKAIKIDHYTAYVVIVNSEGDGAMLLDAICQEYFACNMTENEGCLMTRSGWMIDMGDGRHWTLDNTENLQA